MESEKIKEPPILIKNETRYLKAGKQLANPSPGEEVVITGMAGRFANADDVYEFQHNLFNQISMVSNDDRRWKPGHPEIPHPTGKINHIEKFDAGFFGIHYRQAQHMNPAARQLLERAYEAVMDAGYHPDQLRGTRTGVYIGATYAEVEKTWFFDKLESPSFAVTGVSRSTLAHWISYCMSLEGCSYIANTACSTSAEVVNNAYIDIRNGKCDYALVGAMNLCLHPMMNLSLYRLGILSLDGVCKSFDERANGYVRSEGIAVVLLQKASSARRIYSQIYHVKTNCDGFKQKGIQQPSSITQQELISDVFEECGITPEDLDYFEAHATGTHVGDLIEVKSIDKAIGSKRETPLYIGTTKSLLGHTECTSALSAIIKVVLGMQNNCLLPNSNYLQPRKVLKGIQEGRMMVVTKVTPWPLANRGFAAINSFGFGGTNGHILLKKVTKQKVDDGKPTDDLPRLICVSGRTPHAVNHILNDVKGRTLDKEFVRLLHEVFRDEISAHPYRGYSIMTKQGETNRSFKQFDGRKRPLCLVFDGPCEKLLSLRSDLLKFPLFKATVEEVHRILSSKAVNIMQIMEQGFIEDSLITVTNLTIQIALTIVLKTLGVSFDHVMGCSVGELAAAYADDVLTLEQAILAGFYVGCYQKSRKDQAKLLQQLQQLISKPKQGPTKWITAPMSANTNVTDYLMKNLLNFPKPNGLNSILPSETIVFPIGSTSNNFQSFTKVSIESTENGTSKRENSLLHCLGRLYELGYNPKLEKLYPKVEWPVSMNTPMISPIIKWNHTENWFVPRYEIQDKLDYGKRIATINLEQSEWSFLSGHVLDGRNIMPAMGYLSLVWETLAMVIDEAMLDMQVAFENVRFHRATNIPANGDVKLTVLIHKISGKFTVEEGEELIVSGKVYVPNELTEEIQFTPPGIFQNVLLTSEEIYHELKLRGYDYKGSFRGLDKCDITIGKGLLKWDGNWVAFVDNMLQMKMLQNYTRSLFVPVGIEKLIINAKSHVQYASGFVKNFILPVYVYKEIGAITSGGIEIRGLTTHSITRSTNLQEPLLETHKFIPNETKLSAQESVRVNLQVFLENIHGSTIRVVESLDKTSTHEALVTIIHQILDDYPMVIYEIVVLTNEAIKLGNITVENRSLTTEVNSCSLVVIYNGLLQPKIMEDALRAVLDGGFILSREDVNFHPKNIKRCTDLEIITVHRTEVETFLLFRKITKGVTPVVIDISSNNKGYDYLPAVQNEAENSKEIVIFAQNGPLNGMLGLVNELRKPNIKYFFIIDKAPNFDINNNFYSSQLQKGLIVNVFSEGKWGTYRSLLLKKQPMIQNEFVVTSMITKGDLSSLSWIEGGPVDTHGSVSSYDHVQVYYSAIHSQDVTVATRRVSFSRVGAEDHCKLGMEYSGRNLAGRRIMGLVNGGSLATVVTVDSNFTWEVPSGWSLEDAVTVPAAYATAIYALIVIGNIKPKQSILIHNGAGNIGQAAINIALYYNCNIYLTVQNEQERNFITKQFPEIPEAHIMGMSRFQQIIFHNAYGYGVNIVLHSLNEEHFEASLRCVAPSGKLINLIKPYSMGQHTIGLQYIRESRSLHGISLDMLLGSSPSTKQEIADILIKGIEAGYVKPLSRTIFKYNEVEQAFRYAVAQKDVGQVVVNIRHEEPHEVIKPGRRVFKGLARFYCKPERSYLIFGKLDGFGFEMIDWLVLRGAKKLILVSENEQEEGYAALRINTWRRQEVTIKTLKHTKKHRNIDEQVENLMTEEDCVAILDKASKLGTVEGIFFMETKSKCVKNRGWAEESVIIQKLDLVSRKRCPILQYFVVFSVGTQQENFSHEFNNSVVERICERRKGDGFPALVVRWACMENIDSLPDAEENQTEQTSDIIKQNIVSCINVMDTLLRQDEAVVSSKVLSKKSTKTEDYTVADVIQKAIGLKDLKTISAQTTLSELGMDSILAAEIKQLLEKEFQLTFTAHDVRNMSFQRLQELIAQKSKEN